MDFRTVVIFKTPQEKAISEWHPNSSCYRKHHLVVFGWMCLSLLLLWQNDTIDFPTGLSLKRGFGRCKHGFGECNGFGALDGFNGLGEFGGFDRLGRFDRLDGVSGFEEFGGFSGFDRLSGFGGFVFLIRI